MSFTLRAHRYPDSFLFQIFQPIFQYPSLAEERNICHGSDRDLISKVIAGSNLSI